MKRQNKNPKSFSYENEANEENNSDYESAEGDHQGNFLNSTQFAVRSDTVRGCSELYEAVEIR